MATTSDRNWRVGVHPVHAALLAGMLPLFLGALLSDVAYARSYEIQWANFASWLVAGALVFCGFAGLWAVVELVRADRRGQRPWLYVALLAATFVLGFINALVHAKDAWASMPDALILSIIVFILALAATWVGMAGLRVGGAA